MICIDKLIKIYHQTLPKLKINLNVNINAFYLFLFYVIYNNIFQADFIQFVILLSKNILFSYY